MVSLRETGLRAFAAPDRRPIPQWAAENVVLPAVLTIGGNFNPEISRHFLGIFEALQDDKVRSVTLLKPIGSGGSLVADIWTLWLMANDPGAMMGNFQTDPDAKDYSKDRLGQMLRNCPPTAALLLEDNIQEKKFRHGMPLYIQGPSLSNFQAKRIRYLRNDEVWMWEPGRLGQALGRIADWKRIHMSKVFNVSQAGIENDALDLEFKKGDRREWTVPCPECGKLFEAAISGRREDQSLWGLRWDPKAKDRFGDWNLSAVRKSVWYECPHCRGKLDNERQTRAHWNTNGLWRATNPEADPENVSFHFSAIISDLWADLAEEFCAAMNAMRSGVLELMIAFVQKKEVRSWTEARLFQSAAAPKFRPTKDDWADESRRFMTVDCQAEGVFWVMVRAWSKRGESRRLHFAKAHSEAELLEIQAKFKVPGCSVLIDSGAFTKRIYAMCCRNGWIALKGEDKTAFTHTLVIKGQATRVWRSYSELRRGDPEGGEAGQSQRFAKLLLWSNPTIKDRLQSQIDRGLWLEPETAANDPLEAEYGRQMRSEFRREKRDQNGQIFRVWVCPTGNNHLRDCACMQVVAATITGHLPDLVRIPEEAELKEAA
jgi:phage terminase large subunit GpA